MVSYNQLSPKHKAFSLAISSQPEPTSYKAAVMHDYWGQAIQAELNALNDNHTWTLTDLPPGKRAIGCKWVFRAKYIPDGSVECHKARLVAKGFTQTEGLDYFETFRPVAKMTTIRLIFALAATHNWHLKQLDVNTAFLHGNLHEEVYMTLPPGITASHPGQVYNLHKSLYGLKQASRQWNCKLTEALLACGFSQSKANYPLFVKLVANRFTAILVHVDDLLLAGNDTTEINTVKQMMHNKFTIKDLGDVKYFLGMEVARSNRGIALF